MSDQANRDRRTARGLREFSANFRVPLLHNEGLPPMSRLVLPDAFQQSRPEGAHQHCGHSVPQAYRSVRVCRFPHIVQEGGHQQVNVLVALLLQTTQYAECVLAVVAGHCLEEANGP